MAEKSIYWPHVQEKCGIYRNSDKLCSPYEAFRYIQPPKAERIKPTTHYQLKSSTMEGDSTYKKSYLATDHFSVHQTKPAPMIQQSNIPKNMGDFEKESMTRLSYPGHRCIETTKPILPVKTNLFGDGSYYRESTTKHDFSPKCSGKRDSIIPVRGILKPCGGMEKQTTNNVSFMPINVLVTPPPKPIKPVDSHGRPSASLESETTHKASFIAVSPSTKDKYPRATRSSVCKRNVPPEKQLTTYEVSYQETNKSWRKSPYYPEPCLNMIGDGKFYDGGTIYKASYMAQCGKRPQPAANMHKANLELSRAEPEMDTAYKISFPSHCNRPISKPIPPPASSLRFTGPIENITTNKMAYKPNCQPKQGPIIPEDGIKRTSGSCEKKSLAQMSYVYLDVMNYERAKPFKPIRYNPGEQASYETTQKSSFLSLPAQPKRRPILQKSSFERPETPTCPETIQRTSFMPPGKFIGWC